MTRICSQIYSKNFKRDPSCEVDISPLLNQSFLRGFVFGLRKHLSWGFDPGNVSLGLWMSKNWLHHNSLLLPHKLKILYRNTELGILFLHFVQQKQFIMRHGWVIYINIPHLSTFYICNVEDIIRTRNLLTNCPPYISAQQHPDRTKKNAWKIFKGKISSNKFSNKAKIKKLQLLHLVKRYLEFWTCSEWH